MSFPKYAPRSGREFSLLIASSATDRAHIHDRPGRETFSGTGVELPATPGNFHAELSQESVQTRGF